MNKLSIFWGKVFNFIEIALCCAQVVILLPFGIARYIILAFTLLTKEERELLRRHKRFRRAQENLGMMSDGEIEMLMFANMQSNVMQNSDLSNTARLEAYSSQERREQHVKEEWGLVQEEIKVKGISGWKVNYFG